MITTSERSDTNVRFGGNLQFGGNPIEEVAEMGDFTFGHFHILEFRVDKVWKLIKMWGEKNGCRNERIRRKFILDKVIVPMCHSHDVSTHS